MENHKKSPVLKLYLAIIFLVAGAACAFVFWQQKNGPENYSSTDSYKISDDARHSGMSFLKPTGFVIQQNTPLPKNAKILFKPAHAEFASQKVIDGVSQNIAGLTASSVFNLNSDLPGIVKPDPKLLDDNITNPSAKNYDIAVAPIRNYATNNLNPDIAHPIYDLKFSNPVKLKAHDHGWQSDFTATPLVSGKQTLKGSVVEIVGKNGTYYLTVYAVTKDWDFNQSVWPLVVNSIKVDL